MSRIKATLCFILGLTTLSACAEAPQRSIASYTPSPDKPISDGSYLIANYPGTKAVGNIPATDPDAYTSDQVNVLQQLNYSCHKELDKYIPSVSNEIANIAVPTGWKTGVGSAIGGSLAIVGRVTGVGFWDFVKEVSYPSAGAAFGSGEAAAEDRHNLAVKYVNFACMTGFVGRAQQKGILKGMTVIPWVGSGFAKPQYGPTGDQIVMPENDQADADKRQAAHAADSNQASSSSQQPEDDTAQPMPAPIP